MLEGIDTGYEEKFDFPFRDLPPRQFYLLATVPRTGSSWLSHLLWQTGCLGAPLEYLNFLPTGPFHFASGAPDKQISLWRSLLHRRTSPNGVFGLKCFPMQLRELQRDNPSLCMEVLRTLFSSIPKARVMRLRRRDRDGHAISLARASLSGIWRKEQEPAEVGAIPFSQSAIDEAMQLIDRQDADWDRLFTEGGAEQLTVWYEEAVREPDDAIVRIAAFLEVELDPVAAISVPQVERQSKADAQLWREQLRGT